jgi:hypothetical protein
MSRGHAIILKTHIVKMLGVYIKSFPRAYLKKFPNAETADVQSSLEEYSAVIEAKTQELVTITGEEIGFYTNLYNVHTNQSADEFKLIYYVGIALERHLKSQGLDHVGKAHMYAMIGMLDYRLRELQIFKPLMSKAMLTLVDTGRFHVEMGRNGCYLLYKCVSTVDLFTSSEARGSN